MLTVVDVSIVRACVTIVVAFLLATMFIVATISNSLIVVLFVRRRGMRTLPNRFVLNLAAINLVSTCGLLPLLLTDLFLPPPSAPLCHAVDAIATFVVSSSVLATLLVAGDRYAAVTDALRYHAIVTKPRSLVAIAGCWAAGLLVTGLSLLVPAADKHWEACPRYDSASAAASWYAPALALLLFVVPLAALVWMYVRIYLCAHKNSERQRRHSLGMNPGELTVPMMAANGRPVRTQSLRVQQLRNSSSLIVNNLKHKISNASLFMYREEGRTAKVSLVVVVMFFACWLPFFLCQLVGAFVAFSPSVAHVSALLVVSNSAVSPFVYSFRSRRTQRELRRLLGLRVSSGTATRPLRRTHTNPAAFPLMDTIPPSPLETNHFRLPAAKRAPPSFLYSLVRKSNSVPSVQAALLQSTLPHAQLFTFPEPHRIEVTAATCGLPRGSFSSECSDASQQSSCTDQTDASGR
ncbi:alpha-1B adrenergic receptor-like [Pollicipes pollicipes]|uniref:alpha-1B adrenergic receptor-like n=1 Tax=Pollicipes pollicipes TaxID=41117 RepID=UPI001884FD0D|nr:alpha-1B adrenergic receptor-like [Pollicipes pollicipes]XP_037092401.1 alpha-1B adrenergic receptor-like [Pollicipes pollicipes]